MSQTIEIVGTTPQAAAYAQEELVRFLEQAGYDLGPSSAAAWRLQLRIDPRAAPFSFGVEHVTRPGGGRESVLFGHDRTCLLHAVYTFLEQIGFLFEITGPVWRGGPAHQAPPEGRLVIEPRVRWRGIRQHINFPMDLSGYPLDEAREYIRNLARLRFNAITFHSYPNQFVAGPQVTGSDKAGYFFYGQRHAIPDHPVLKRVIRNQRVFCIPEIEPVYDDPAERSRRAVAWLREVMAEARRVGLRIQFSFEPRLTSTDASATLATARAILRDYPLIDVLELISEEEGWGGSPITLEQLRACEREHFREGLIPADLAPMLLHANAIKVLGQVGHALRAAKALRRETNVPLAVGVYCVQPKYLRAALMGLEEFLPKEISLALLPGHGSGRLTRYLDEAGVPAVEARQRTMLYGWIELDGGMYVQQNAVAEIRCMIEDALDRLQGAPIYGVCFNHWRTTENRITARYAAEATLQGPIPVIRFYHDYAARLGIQPAGEFSAAMQALGIADQLTCEYLGNIAFCAAGCWCPGGVLSWHDPAMVDRVRGQLQYVADWLRDLCLPRTTEPAGRQVLSFLLNRTEASVTYLRGILKGTELQALNGHRKAQDLTPEQRARTVAICNEALALFEDYIRICAEQMPDRGCEGTLVSVWHVLVYHLMRIRADYGGAPPAGDRPAFITESVDAPPPLR